MTHRNALLVGLLSSCFVLGSAPSAMAEGGTTIAGAPSITPGVQEFGNLINGAATQEDCYPDVYTEWWLLPVVAGDHVVIDWQAQELKTMMSAYPAGTTDYTFPNTNSLFDQGLNSNGQNEQTLTATATGTIPIAFYSTSYCSGGTPGPYNFTAYVTHGLVSSLAVTATRPRSNRTYFAVRLNTPTGTPVINSSTRYQVQLRKGGRWINTGTLGPAPNFSMHWGRSTVNLWEYLRVVVSIPGYVTATSPTLKTRAV